jgi:hypothetical protein
MRQALHHADAINHFPEIKRIKKTEKFQKNSENRSNFGKS